MAVLEQVLPVGTLVLGAVLQQASTNFGSQRAARAAARELLAEHGRFVWEKDDNSWIELQVYEAKLRSALVSAHVSRGYADRAIAAMTKFWQGIELDPSNEGWYAPNPVMDELTAAVLMLNDFLDESVRTRRRALRGKPSKY